MSEVIKERHCPNCGAIMAENEMVCKYCGYEDLDMAQAREAKEIKDIENAGKEEIKKMPKKLLGQTTKRVFAAIVFFAFMIAAFVVVRKIVNEKVSNAGFDKKQEKLAYYEEIYQSGDYRRLEDEYLDDSENYGASAGKYSNTASMGIYTFNNVDALKHDKENIENVSTEVLAEDIRTAIYALCMADDYRDKGFIYGEGEAIESMEQLVIDTLKDYWLMSDDEIKAAKDMYVDRKTDYSELAEDLLDRSKN